MNLRKATELKLMCIILAAGRSERLGRNKLLETIGGRTVIGMSTGAIPAELFDGVAAVVSSEDTEREFEKLGIRCARYEGGAVSDSIRCGLRSMGALPDGVMFVNADQPFMSRESIGRMVSEFVSFPDSIIRIRYGETEGNPVLFPGAAVPDLLALEGEKGGAAVIKSGKYPVRHVEAKDAFELFDADTDEDIEKARNHIREGKDVQGE